MKRVLLFLMLSLAGPHAAQASDKKPKQAKPSPLDEFLIRARQANPLSQHSTSLFSPSAPNLFLFRDVKARNVNDIITIQILESATASNSANTSTERKGDVNVSASALGGLEKGNSALNFAKILSGNSALTFDGTGSTSRSGELQAWLTARVAEVLPNGDLVIEGTKDVTINRERQSLTVRGVVRTRDVTPGNVVLSTAIAHMEVKFDGKGVVSSANTPGFLYWLFSKILPF